MNSDVLAAFDLLLEVMENTIDELGQEGARASQNKDFATVRQLAEKGEQITEFRQKIVSLQEEWNNIISSESVQPKKYSANLISKSKKKKLLPRGLRTSPTNFYEPILRSLVDSDGRGLAKDVLKLVERSMKSSFNPYDLEGLKSGVARWENTANWARLDMVRLGLLLPDSERGIWEITEKGKKWLEERKSVIKS